MNNLLILYTVTLKHGDRLQVTNEVDHHNPFDFNVLQVKANKEALRGNCVTEQNNFPLLSVRSFCELTNGAVQRCRSVNQCKV